MAGELPVNSALASIIIQARTNNLIEAARNYASLAGVSFDTALLIMRDIRAETNWKREDPKDEQERDKHTDTD